MSRQFLVMVLIIVGCCGGNQTLAQNLGSSNAPNAESPSQHTPSRSEGPNGKGSSKLDKYFERYCDYTGGLGIGLVATDTYDYKFRQRLKSTRDPELKRLFVLQHLYRDALIKMVDYERGQIRIGKNEFRPMTREEMETARKDMLAMLDDLEAFDPTDPEHEIAATRSKLK